MVCNINRVAGKTQLINHFLINDEWYLVDLPGYGFAKTSKKSREQWGQMIHQYLMKRKNLRCTFLLVDIRLEPQKIDLDFIEWMGINQLPFVIIFTKSDKLNKQNLIKNIELYKSTLSEKWAELPQFIVSSSVKTQGKEAILELISETNQLNKLEE